MSSFTIETFSNALELFRWTLGWVWLSIVICSTVKWVVINFDDTWPSSTWGSLSIKAQAFYLSPCKSVNCFLNATFSVTDNCPDSVEIEYDRTEIH